MSFGGNILSTKTAFNEPDEVNKRLGELGLTADALRQARMRGLSASLECTASHTPTAAGTYAYHETVRWLRDLLRPLGWSGNDSQNRGLTVNADKTRAIIVASGDENTGCLGYNPSTRNPKGPTTVQAVRDNTIGWLFSELEEDRESQLRAASMETWILLIYRDDAARKFRGELSLPISTNGRLCPDLWRERIILDEIDFDNASSAGSNAPTGTTPEVTVEIRRRG